MALISPRQTRITAGLPRLRKELPAKEAALYAGFEAAKAAITSILKTVDTNKLKITNANDLYKISVSLAALIKAQADFERWNAERFGFLKEAKTELLKLVRNALATQPELREQLGMLIEAAAAKEKARQIEAESD